MTDNSRYSVLVVDDDPVSRTIVQTILEAHDYRVSVYESASEAIDAVEHHSFDLIISDYMMPQMSGGDFLKVVRANHIKTAFMFLSAAGDSELAAELIKTGADDYVDKPIQKDQLLFRVEKNIRDKLMELTIAQVEAEEQARKAEEQRIFSWRQLYGAKDITQTKELITFLTRTIDQGGGFMWVDLVKEIVASHDAGTDTIEIDRDLLNLALDSAGNIQAMVGILSFLGRIDSMEMALESLTPKSLARWLLGFKEKNLHPLAEKNSRSLDLQLSTSLPTQLVNANTHYLGQVLHELVCNGIKYSPEGTALRLFVDHGHDDRHSFLRVSLWSTPLESRTAIRGQKVVGIPYEFSEAVFNLFTTLESYPVPSDDEEWGYGTGLFIARNLIRHMGGTMEAHNKLSYLGETPEVIVSVNIMLPFVEE